MTWHSKTVPTYRFVLLLSMIRSEGGTVTSCKRDGAGIHVTWTTRSGR